MSSDEIRCIRMTAVCVPTYVVGPLHINGEYAKGKFDVPLAVTELPIVPTVKRGLKVTGLAEGIDTRILRDEMTRAPLLGTNSHDEAMRLRNYIDCHFEELKDVVSSTTRYGYLNSLDAKVAGADIYLRIGMVCGDAAGHNMTTQAAKHVSRYIIDNFDGAVRLISLSSNYCTDKKPAKINVDKGRGKSVMARVVLPERIVHDKLHTTGRKLAELNQKKNVLGSKLAGSLGHNAHHANIVGAMFLATGQDIANVVSGSLGNTTVECADLEVYFAVNLPALIVGTIGGGTNLDYAKQNLHELGCAGSGDPIGSNSKKLAEIIAATVLAGELSLMAALTNDDELIETHLRYER